MVLIGASIGEDGVIPAALDVTANLILEVSAAPGGDTLARLVDRFGSHRFTRRADAIEEDSWREAHV